MIFSSSPLSTISIQTRFCSKYYAALQLSTKDYICNTYLPHPCFLKSFILVVATVFPNIFNPPMAVMSPPALSSMKKVRDFTRWNLTQYTSIASAISDRLLAVSVIVCAGSTSSTSYKKYQVVSMCSFIICMNEIEFIHLKKSFEHLNNIMSKCLPQTRDCSY